MNPVRISSVVTTWTLRSRGSMAIASQYLESSGFVSATQ